jgi:hypothetical protein
MQMVIGIRQVVIMTPVLRPPQARDVEASPLASIAAAPWRETRATRQLGAGNGASTPIPGDGGTRGR